VVSMTRVVVRAVRDWRRAVRLLLIVALGSLFVLGSAVTGTEKAYAATDVRTPLAAGPTIASPFAVFGTTVVLGAYRSTNTGGGWAPDATLSSAVWRYAGEGKLVGYTNTDSTYNALVFTPSSGASQTYALPASPVSMNATWSLSYGSSGTYTAKNFLTGATATPTSPSPAAGETAQITPSGAVLWSNTAGTFAVAPTPTDPAGAWVSIPGVRDFLATQDKLLYVTYDANKVSICSRPLISLSSAPTCAVAMSGVDYSDPNTADFTLLSFGTLTVMTATLASGSSLLPAYVWSGSTTAAQIQLPAGFSIDQPEAVPMPRLYGDSAYVVVRDKDTVGSIKKVNADGTLSAGFLPPNTSAAITSLAVAPDRVVAADARDASTLNASWSRAVSGAGFSATVTPLPQRASWLDASAGRTAVSGPIGLLLFDRGTPTPTHVFTDASFTSMSGPYVTQQIDDASGTGVTMISTADGAAVATFPGWSGLLFGSQYVTQTKGDAGAGPVALTVNSLTGGTAAKRITLPAETATCWASTVWGDNVALSCGTSIRVYSMRTGGYVASYEGPANTYVALAAFGDGYAVIRQGTATTTNLLWNLKSSTTTALPCTGWGPIATDGEGHLACTSNTELIWLDYAALSTAAPRVLGMLAPASVNFTTTAWTTQIDATKPLAAGSLVIKKADGTVVRTLPTPATTDGSLRITWDGRDMYGDPAPAGTYTYVVAADAADGTGTMASVDGTGPATATVVISANVSPDYTKFVQASYQDFLGRAPSQYELTFQTSALSTGNVTKSGYLLSLANSPEWLNAIVTKMYTDTLGRAPDAAGLAYWTGLIRNKTFSVADVASRFYASDEYYLYHAGGTPTSWVTSLYTKLLSRSPDAAGLQYWVGLTNQKGYGRDKVAYDLYQSTESRMLRVTALYQTLLKRDPDATGLPYWTAQVLTTGDIVLAMNLADSQEYWLRARARF